MKKNLKICKKCWIEIDRLEGHEGVYKGYHLIKFCPIQYGDDCGWGQVKEDVIEGCPYKLEHLLL